MEQKPIACVTGASSGIGAAIAQHLMQRGYRVYGGSRRKRPASGGDFHFVELDVNDSDSVSQAVRHIVAEEDRIDLLVNCAGTGIIGSVEEMPIETIKEVFETNFYGVVRMCQAVLPVMRERGNGCIINISSIAGEVGLPFRAFYSASKFALEGLTEALRMEVRPHGIHVTLIQPGDFKTAIAQSRPEVAPAQDSPYAADFEATMAAVNKGMGHAPTPERIGPLVARIAAQPAPAMRYRIGAFTETLTPHIKKWLPFSWFERIIMGHYGIKKTEAVMNGELKISTSHSVIRIFIQYHDGGCYYD